MLIERIRNIVDRLSEHEHRCYELLAGRRCGHVGGTSTERVEQLLSDADPLNLTLSNVRDAARPLAIP
jgi:S-adenosylmethionine:diacylglycerol 3-amino-3-carboxypropyl transferase